MIKNLAIYYISIFFLLLTYSCQSAPYKYITPIDTFYSTENINLLPIAKLENNVSGISIHQDSLLILRNNLNGTGYFFSVFSLRNKTIKYNFLKAGRKENESLGFIAYGFRESSFWVYDMIKDKIISGEIEDSEQSYRSVNMPIFHYQAVRLNDSLLLASGNYDSAFKLAEFNMATGEITDSLYAYPKNFEKVDKMDYESFLYVSPDHKYAALATRYADGVEFFDLTGGTSKAVVGPEKFKPDLSRVKQHIGYVSSLNSNTRYGFLSGKSTSKHLYLLFSGHNNNSSHLFYGSTIYVYDWEGKPVKKIVLDHDILDFAVSNDDSLLYTWNPIENSIEFSNIEL